MSEGPTAMPGLPDPAERMAALQRIAERSRKVAELWLGGSGKGAPALPASLAHDFMEAASRLMLQPDKLVQAHAQLWQDYMRLWQGTGGFRNEAQRVKQSGSGRLCQAPRAVPGAG
jgi:hypothetical protein